MKKFLPLLFLGLLAILNFSSLNVFADFNQSYKDYLSSYDQYRNQLNIFKTTKNRYLTYKTLVSQNEAFKATKDLLIIRNQVIISYLKLLQEKKSFQNLEEKNRNEIDFYLVKNNEIQKEEDFDKLLRLSKDIEEHYQKTTLLLAQQLLNSLLLEEIKVNLNQLNEIKNGFENKIIVIEEKGTNVKILKKWLLSINEKSLEIDNQLNKTSSLIDNLNFENSTENLRKIDTFLTNARQELKELLGYLKEIKDELKYGNY